MTTLQRNILYNLVGQGLVLGLGVVANRFIFNRLGGDAFGLLQFNLLFTALIVAALDLGVSSTTVREISARSAAEPSYVLDLIRTASLLYWALSLGLAALIYLASPLVIAHWLHLQSISPAVALIGIRILSISALTALPRTLYVSMFRGRQRMVFNNLIDVATSLTQQAGIVLILLRHGTFDEVVWWIAGSATVGLAAYAGAAARLFGWQTLIPGWSQSVIRRNLRFTGHMTAVSALSLVHTQADKVFVSKFLSLTDFGFYSFISNVTARASFVTGSIAQAALPSLSRLAQTGDHKGVRTQYRKLQDVVCFGTLPIFAAIPLGGLPLLAYMFGDHAAHYLILPLGLLSLGYFMNATLTVPYVVSLAVGRPEIAVRTNLVALVVVTPATLILVARFGIAGGAFSWVLYHMVAFAYQLPQYCKHCVQMPSRVWYRHTARVMLLGLAAYGPCGLLALLWNAEAILPAAGLYLAGSAVYLAGAYALVEPDMREMVRRTSRRLPGRRVAVRP